MTNPMNPHTPPLPPPQPLDEEEHELARALRGLPSSMPPPELDARILGASRRAIAMTAKPRAHGRGWVWGLSTAAAAVLAAGVLLKMHTQGRDQAIEPSAQAPANSERVFAEPAASPAAASPTEVGTVASSTASADMETAQPAATDSVASKAMEERAASAGAPADMAAAKSVGPASEPAKQERDELQAAKSSATVPSGLGAVAPADKSTAGQAAAASNAAPQPFPMTSSAPPRQAQAPAASLEHQREAKPVPLPPPPPPPPIVTTTRAFAPSPVLSPAPAATTAADMPRPPTAPAAQPLPADQFQKSGYAADARKDAALDSVEVTGSRLKRANGSVLLPSIDEDAKLPSAQWIERIRARVDAADGVSARESLRRYVARYPNAEIPADLAPLR